MSVLRFISGRSGLEDTINSAAAASRNRNSYKPEDKTQSNVKAEETVSQQCDKSIAKSDQTIQEHYKYNISPSNYDVSDSAVKREIKRSSMVTEL